MLSLKKIEEKYFKDTDFHICKYNLLINSKIANRTTVSGSYRGNKPETFDISSEDSEVSRELLNYEWSELPNLTNISLLLDSKISGFVNRLLVEKDNKSEKFFVNLYLNPFLLGWKNIYSYKDFEETIVKQRDSLSEKSIELETWNDAEQLSIEFKTELFLEKVSLIENLSSFINICFSIFDTAITELISSHEKNELYLNFNFPKSIKISCEQYLLYFAKFLQDLGINATSNLKEEAGKVLFSVTPTDDVKALDKICEALAIYLKLPESPIIFDESFKSMRTQQQIENLQHSQKMTARELQLMEKLLVAQSSMIQEKNSIISQKDSVINQQNKVIEKILSKSIMMDSVENKEELEEIYDGLKIGESKFLKEQLGISLNPAKVIKTAVKNTFGKEEKDSVLGLDEE